MTTEIKPRIVYKLVRTDKPEDGTDVYVGSTSKSLKLRLQQHRKDSKRCKNKLYTRIKEVGVDNWGILPLLIHVCNQEEIREFERCWIALLSPDLNTYSPLDTNNKWDHIGLKELKRKHYYDSIKSKRYYCDICDKAFGNITNLERHLKTLKHSYAYMDSVD